ncbi:prephenate dehydrogenase/arogenate dehydrogenase family protein [Candidatus Peregrinibacteria bacterium]|nr:prephenate dehydrogenase/arogenate dehydrogenase family protein [Candidatus Peregrinibacteria bacterium]
MKTVGIIGGKGIIGSFMAKFWRSHGFRVLISDLRTKLSNKKLAQRSDVIVVSVPIHITKKVIREIAPILRRDQLLMDVTSLKIFPVQEMLKSKASVIGLHPMFRPGSGGMRGQIMVMCPARCTSAQKKWLRNLLKKGGATVAEMTPKKHDELMGIVQALIHFHSLVLGMTLRSLKTDLRAIMKVMSPIYRMQFDVVCRIFAQNPELYASIGMENPETKKITAHFLESTKKLRQILTAKNIASFVEEFSKTARFLGPYSKKALLESDELLTVFQKKHRL